MNRALNTHPGDPASSRALRGILFALAAVVGACGIASAMAGITSPAVSSDGTANRPPSSEAGPAWLDWLWPLRSDLKTNQTLASALATLQSRQPSRIDDAFAGAKRSLAIRPYDGALWLALALLQASRDPHDPTLVEALKMSYFVAPDDARLMPLRLDAATRFDALSIPDLREVVRGDVRLMLTRGDETLRAGVKSAYRRASDIGRAFIEETVQAIDPSLLPQLRG